MRRFLAPTIAGALCLALALLPARAAQEYRFVLSGGQQSPGSETVGLIRMKANNLHPFSVRLEIDPATKAVKSGTWELEEVLIGADGKRSVNGTLQGKLSGGSVTFAPNNAIQAVGIVELEVGSGTGAYENTKTGKGKFRVLPATQGEAALTGELLIQL